MIIGLVNEIAVAAANGMIWTAVKNVVAEKATPNPRTACQRTLYGAVRAERIEYQYIISPLNRL